VPSPTALAYVGRKKRSAHDDVADPVPSALGEGAQLVRDRPSQAVDVYQASAGQVN
jgi:hypothetical protein